jgi:hypothetical protein
MGDLDPGFAGLPNHLQNWAGDPAAKPAQQPSIPLGMDAPRRWQTCPVCHGTTHIPRGFYAGPYEMPTTSAQPEQCRSCGGRGIVR